MKSENGSGQEDLYVFTKNSIGEWNDPTNLGSTINTSESEISPFLSADKKTMFFSSKGHGGYGDMDIFKSERLYDSWNVWSKPKNLGDKVNSNAFDGYYSEYGDSIAFFSSNREGKLSDIYEARLIIAKKSTARNQTITISSAQQKKDRNYISENELSAEYGIPENIKIEASLNSSINENKTIKEQLWFLAGKLSRYPKLKVAFEIVPMSNIPSDILVTQSNRIIAELFSEISLLGVSRSNIEYDGIELRDSLENRIEQKVRIVLLFFRD
jgi:hypothetical protein